MTCHPVGSRSIDEDLYQANDAPKKLFSAILDILADTDVFSHSTSPSIFIVYAHDNDKEGTANAWCVRHLIEWLGAIRSRTLSDKSPLPLWSTREGDTAALRNILDNQFCLIPAHNNSDDTGTIASVDSVVLCGSGLLRRYYEDPFTSSYIDAIEKSYTEGQLEFTNLQALKDKVRDMVESNYDRPGFHHVLTELAFLKLRRSYSHGNNHGIIPVALDEDLMTYLPLRNPSDLVLKLKSFREADLHRLFFHLLRQIYTEAQSLIDRFESCYKVAIDRLKNEAATTQGITQEKSGAIVYSEIHKAIEDLRRLDGAALRNVIQESRVQSILSHLSEKLQTPITDERRRRLLSKLSTVPYRDRKDRNPERIKGTCEWFTSHPLFQNWHHSKTSSLLWVSADPGCGKSVLAKYLVDDLLPTTDTRTACYFFFKDDFEDQRSLESAMRCLLHQLFIQRPALLTDEILKRFEGDGQLFTSFLGLWDILTNAASHKGVGEIICILDALDECEESGQSRLARALNKLYDNEESASLKFLLTSRPYTHIQREFQVLEDRRPTIHLSGENQAEVDKISKEIDIVIGAKVEEIGARLKLEGAEKQLLRDELTLFPHRTYLWAYLVFDVINNSIETTRGYLRASIREFPQTVEAAYEKILCGSRDVSKARRLLHMVVAANRPLSLKEMATALAIREEHKSHHQLELEPEIRFRSTVRELCGLFVNIVDSKIYLIHQTAREFLVYKPSRFAPDTMKWQNSLRPIESHSILAELCTRHLCFPDIEVSSRDNRTALVEYAANNWAAHFREAYNMYTQSIVCRAEWLCDTSTQRCKEWIDIYSSTDFYLIIRKDTFSDDATALMIASYFGLEKIVRVLLEKKGLDLDKKDDTSGRSALWLACKNGHEMVVKTLLSHAPKRKGLFKGFTKPRSLNLKNKMGQALLVIAVVMGHEGIVRHLLEKGAKLDAQNEDGQTPLFRAASVGHERIVQLLLKKEAKLNIQDKYGQTPLFRAASEGHEGAVRCLLEKGAKLDIRGRNGQMPLFGAARRGHEGVVWCLLEKGAELNIQDDDGNTPLFEAAFSGYERIIRHFLEKGAKLNIRNKHGQTPLFRAAYRGHEGAVRCLLEKGAELNIQDDDGNTPLFDAVWSMNEGAVRYLLEKGAKADIQDKGGQTPLFTAARLGQERIVRYLLEKGAKADIQDKHGHTALCNAKEGTVQLLQSVHSLEKACTCS